MSEGSYTQHIKNFEQALDGFNKRLDKIDSDTQDVKQTLNDVMNALIGNELSGDGLVSQVREQERKLEELQNKYNQAKWLLIGVSAGSGGLVSGIIQWIL